MRKRLIVSSPPSPPGPGTWLDLEHLASVEATSEDPHFPIESAFAPEAAVGWRASDAGEQLIRLVFDQPQDVHRIQLHFSETAVERTQEFVLHWAPRGGVLKEIVRQRWNFSPAGATTELEDYSPHLAGVSVLQLTIKPDISHGPALATLKQWRVA